MTRIVLISALLFSSLIITGCEKPKAPVAKVLSGSEQALVDQVQATRGAYAQSVEQLVTYYSKLGSQMKLDWALNELGAIKGLPQTTPVTSASLSGKSERDLLEETVMARQAYRQSVERVVEYYQQSGDKVKLAEAQKDLAGVNATPQYSYVVEAAVAGPDLRAMTSVPAAETLYKQALDQDNKARFLGFDTKVARQALEMYNQVIRQYPTSNKIGMAAFKAGSIYEDLGDYSLAALYYERAAQWDKNVPFSARFRAAYMYDRFLNDKQKALILYQDSLNNEYFKSQYRAYANNRVIELSKKEIQ